MIWAGARSEVGFAHERSRDEPRAQKTRAKKMAATRAAKFREETPMKGGGFAIKDRNTALQQYADMTLCTQASIHTLSNFTLRKSCKNPT